MVQRSSAFIFGIIVFIMSVNSATSAGQGEPPRSPASYNSEALLFSEIPSVTGASKYEQKITEAPSSVSIVTAAEIKYYGYRTLADILRSVSGFYVTYDRNYSYIGVRGFGRPADYNSRVLLLIDGHRMNDNIYDSAMIGTEGILDVDLIDRVEVIRGPGSSLYGSNAFFGVVNIITKRGRDLKGAEISGEVGSFKTYKGRLSYGNRYHDGTEAIVSATGYDSAGDRLYYWEFDPANPNADTRAANNGFTDHTDYDRYQSMFMNIALGDFTAQGAYSSRTKGIPTGYYGIDFNEPANKTVDIRSYGDLKYEHDISSKTSVQMRLTYDYYTYTGDYAYYTNPSLGVLNRDASYGSWWGSELKVQTRLQDRHRLMAGGEFKDNLRQDQQNYDVGGSSYLDDERRSRIWALYFQDELTFSDTILLNAGLRYDHYGSFGGTTNPRLALIVSPTDKSTIKLLYGSAFRAPNYYELYYYVPGFSLPSPNLEPEKIKTTELSFNQYLGDRVRASAAGYYYIITNLINYRTDPASGLSQFENIDEVSATGIELELEGRWSSGAEARGSYIFQRTKDKASGDTLSNSPGQLGKLVIALPLIRERVFAGIEEQYTGRRKTATEGSVAGFFTTNLTLSFSNIAPRLEAAVSVYNVLNKQHGDPVSVDFVQETIQQDGRTYRVKVTYAF